ncbi:MAG: DUF1624 domain-containing protein, partial [Calditrichaeota bacterium]|nr:DUF1624 domain-containing protein [Calditrichota bacterium]
MSSETKSNRFFSIDFLRGLVMIIMALDHTRVFFHADAFLFNPTDIAHSNPLIFLTRWITHFCAPVFIFLAGTSIFFMNGRKSTKEVSLFILKRGLWLMLLELTFFGFGWFFNPNFSLQFLQAIWVIGVSMVIMSAVIFLP